jgi:hypothetical protein
VNRVDWLLICNFWLISALLITSVAWGSLACSADGHRRFVANKRGGIQTLQIKPHPVLNISHAGESLVISTLVPSSPFVWKRVTTLLLRLGLTLALPRL